MNARHSEAKSSQWGLGAPSSRQRELSLVAVAVVAASSLLKSVVAATAAPRLPVCPSVFSVLQFESDPCQGRKERAIENKVSTHRTFQNILQSIARISLILVNITGVVAVCVNYTNLVTLNGCRVLLTSVKVIQE